MREPSPDVSPMSRPVRPGALLSSPRPPSRGPSMVPDAAAAGEEQGQPVKLSPEPRLDPGSEAGVTVGGHAMRSHREQMCVPGKACGRGWRHLRYVMFCHVRHALTGALLSRSSIPRLRRVSFHSVPPPSGARPAGGTLFCARFACVCAGGWARVSAGAVCAPDCAREPEGALRLSAESRSFRAGPARRKAVHGHRLPRTHCSIFSQNASPCSKIISRNRESAVPRLSARLQKARPTLQPALSNRPPVRRGWPGRPQPRARPRRRGAGA